MKSYTVEYTSGAVSKFFAASDREAVTQALSIIGGGVAADQWDSAGENDDGQSCERLLLWSDDESAADDDGANAVAQLCVVR